MYKKTAEILFTISVGVAALTGTASAQNSPGSVAIDASLRGAVERKDVPGVVALVTDRDKVLYQGAFGVADVSTGRPLTTDALFRIASMTKAITSLALMQLIEQGRLGLDDPAEKYLPELVGLKVIESFDKATGAYQLRPASRPPTVRHFLTHTSGLAYPFTSATWRDFKPRAGETYPFGGPLLFDPGERWHYSTSTDVVGRLVEVISGQKLEEYFRAEHLRPAQDDRHLLQRAAGEGPAPRRPAAARRRPHGRADRAADRRSSGSPSPRRSAAAASPRPASDYGRFVRMFLNGGELDGARVLKAETVALMGQNHIGNVSVPALKTAAAAQRRLLLHRRRPRQVGPRLPDHGRSGARQALPRQPELGRHQQYLLLDRSGRGIAGVIMMQYLPFADAKALAVYDAFERGAYQLVNATR